MKRREAKEKQIRLTQEKLCMGILEGARRGEFLHHLKFTKQKYLTSFFICIWVQCSYCNMNNVKTLN